ncbi:MAG: hypothetical protein MUC99_12140 [Anaerolineae bacterium]|jgi:dihydroorotate dehydrogenase (NAD+) catalytic subunit|nr:hypothetical protein [Anaerolineae bacterium]
MDVEIGLNRKEPLFLRSPVMPAAGTFGFGDAFPKLFEVEKLGAIVTRPVGWHAFSPANGTRLVRRVGGAVVHTGLPNPGLTKAIRDNQPLWEMLSTPVILHLIGTEPDDVEKACDRINRADGVRAVELGLKDDLTWQAAADLVKAARSALEKPLLVRLPFPASDEVARAALENGADALVAFAPPRGADRKPFSEKIVPGRVYGPLLKPMVMHAVGRLRRNFPQAQVIACGGIHSVEDARDYILGAGAAAVQLDAAIWVEPSLIGLIARDLAGLVLTRPTDALPDEWFPGIGETDAKRLGLPYKPRTKDKDAR